ncbi:MAG: 3-deoxy-D-manno-octulosonic acid transferase [Roseivirga sp.]|nr:3-deoxy-D-manno-octulosonic acid transferase [Roseivirga sp.]
MALFAYNFFIAAYGLIIRLAALFNPKAGKFINGRQGIFQTWENYFTNNQRPVAWFHAASLGEFEQGRPVIEAFKKSYPEHIIFITFFSPSGYELRKNDKIGDLITYLPLDTPANAKRLLDTVKPSVVFFIKYEFWYHYLNQASQRTVPLYCISAVFTPDHIFFKRHGALHRRMLRFFDHIFVQNHQSLKLLQNIDIASASISGDTRFDRVIKTLDNPDKYPLIEAFKGNSGIMVVGSSWESDMQYLNKVINEDKSDTKFIIAPHEVHEQSITGLRKGLTRKLACITQDDEQTIIEADVLIIDTIGMLSSVYQYGDFAYIGGAFGDGLHNILEAVTFGLPVVFGNKGLDKFPESLELAGMGGAFSISSQAELADIYARLSTDDTFRNEASAICRQYIQASTGATTKIMTYLNASYEG